MRKINTRSVLIIGTSALALALSVIAITAPMGSSSDEPNQILTLVDSPRIVSLWVDESAVSVTGVSSKNPGDAARTLWYETLAAAALAQIDGLGVINRSVLDPSGATIEASMEAVSAQGVDPLGPATLSATEIEFNLASAAKASDVKVTDVHYIDLFGGTAEIVVQPSNVDTLQSASSITNNLLGALGEDSRPYLVTYVDEVGAPQLVLAFVPGVGGDPGQGIAWAAPGVQTDAIIGASFVAGSGK